MSPTPPDDGQSCPVAALNEAIRSLWLDPRVRLTREGRARLDTLYAEWAAAVRDRIVEAA